MKEVCHGRSEPAGLCELREQVEGICVWGKGGWGEAQVYSRDSTPEKGWEKAQACLRQRDERESKQRLGSSSEGF